MAKSTDITGDVVRNAFTLQGLGNGLTQEVRGRLEGLFVEILAALADIDPTDAPRDTVARQRIAQLVTEVEQLSGPVFEEIHTTLRTRLAGIGTQQAKFAAAMLTRATGGAVSVAGGAITVRTAKAMIDIDPIQGELLKQALEGMEANVLRAIRREIQKGVAENETLSQITRRLRGTRASGGGFTGGVLEMTTRGAEGIARTAINYMSNEAAQATFRANDDITEEFRVVATLDGRTTEICQALDGTVWRYDDPTAPTFPAHWNCRTVTIAVIRWKELGLEPPAEGTRASQGGQVPSSTTYSDWLRDQSAGTQDEILGPARAQMFRSGEIGLRDLVRTDGRIVRLEDL